MYSSAAATKEAPQSLPQPSKMYSKAKLDVWTMFNRAAAQANAVNLGQGFMSFPPDKLVIDSAIEAVSDETAAQYAPPQGRPQLLEQLAEHYGPLVGRKLDSKTQVMVSSGANEGIFCALLAFLELGGTDEAIVIEPAFDQYKPNIIMAGGTPVFVPLRVQSDKDPTREIISSNEWKLDMAELESKITSRTKILILNTPQNPTGKVFDLQELEQVAAIAKKHNLLVISDEVYENLYYDDNKHISIASLPGMFERTVICGSVGKLLGVTGWRVGWLVGPQHLITPCVAAHTRTTFVTCTPIQDATALAFKKAYANDYFNIQRSEYLARRQKLMAAFDSVQLPYSVPHGSYFLLVNAARVRIPDDFVIPDYVSERGHSFELCYFFTVKIGISCIPPTEFYSNENLHLAENYVRFAFCKTDDVFEETARRLQAIKQYIVDV
ncbi:hypothetical protein BB561_001717 [Smittium simulii]|uniref:Aminotransferase class I/classII large domain-containing protein n=1 Tax=Smittium simulii TaxID=133385 RepID=A0A2T9YTF5_9FUNG|nr:hypothetical protein BB561_001717 [Smittium simulii]